MKFVLVLAAFVAVVFAAPPQLTDEQKHHLTENHSKCQVEAPLDEAFLAKLKNHEKPDSFPENWGKHSLCMSKASGTINEDGKVNKEKLQERLNSIPGNNAEKVKEAVDDCAKEYETPEETAVKLGECIYKHLGAGHDHKHN